MPTNEEIREHHAQMVAKLLKNPSDILPMTEDNADLVHAVLGIAGEAGELVDAIKKVVIYGQVIDLENVVEELGDLEFYLEGLRQRLAVSRELCLEYNIKKLLTGEKARYAEGLYTDEFAGLRRDKSA